MIEPAKEELHASWVVVDRQATQPESKACPMPWASQVEQITVGVGAAPYSRALHTVGLGLTGSQALGPLGALIMSTRPRLAHMLFRGQAQEGAQPPALPIIPGTPPDRGYEADDEDENPLATMGPTRPGDPPEGSVIAAPPSVGCAP